MLNSKYLFLSWACLILRSLRQEAIPFGPRLKYTVRAISKQLKLKKRITQDTGI